jgi:hypothetical protein
MSQLRWLPVQDLSARLRRLPHAKRSEEERLRRRREQKARYMHRRRQEQRRAIAAAALEDVRQAGAKRQAVCSFEELADDLIECIFQLDRDTSGDMARLAVLSRALRPAAASVERLARARAKEAAAAAAAAEKAARRAAVLAAEATRASLQGARLSVLMDGGGITERWVDAEVQYYQPGSAPTVRGVDSFYALQVHEHSASYLQEIWASTEHFAQHCCTCRQGECNLCEKAHAPSYIVLVAPPPDFVAQRLGVRLRKRSRNK